MKHKITLFILAIAFLSCRQSKLMDEKKDNLIVGKWGIYEMVEFQNNDDSAAIKCSVCPEIVFANDYSGFTKTAGESPRHFSWEIDAGRLAIKYMGYHKIANGTVAGGNYEITYSDKKLTSEIALVDTAKNIKYILRK